MSDTTTPETPRATTADATADPATARESHPETVPVGAEGAPAPEDGPFTCGYCGRPFAREAWLALHRGLDHEGEITAAEREAFEDAYEDEEADLRMFRLQALGVLVLVYFSFLIVYGLVT